jgi:hypothetical protein
MKTYGGVVVQTHVFLTSALVGGEWSTSCPNHFTTEERARYPLDRRLGGPQSLSRRCGEVNILDPAWTRTPTPVVQHVASLYTDCATAALNMHK